MAGFIRLLRRIVSINGRASRAEFWGLLLVIILGLLVFGFIGELAGIRLLAVLFGLVMLIPFLATGMRRMHDAGKNGLLMFVPFYNFFVALSAGQPGPNRYGPDPRVDPA